MEHEQEMKMRKDREEAGPAQSIILKTVPRSDERTNERTGSRLLKAPTDRPAQPDQSVSQSFMSLRRERRGPNTIELVVLGEARQGIASSAYIVLKAAARPPTPPTSTIPRWAWHESEFNTTHINGTLCKKRHTGWPLIRWCFYDSIPPSASDKTMNWPSRFTLSTSNKEYWQGQRTTTNQEEKRTTRHGDLPTHLSFYNLIWMGWWVGRWTVHYVWLCVLSEPQPRTAKQILRMCEMNSLRNSPKG